MRERREGGRVMREGLEYLERSSWRGRLRDKWRRTGLESEEERKKYERREGGTGENKWRGDWREVNGDWSEVKGGGEKWRGGWREVSGRPKIELWQGEKGIWSEVRGEAWWDIKCMERIVEGGPRKLVMGGGADKNKGEGPGDWRVVRE